MLTQLPSRECIMFWRTVPSMDSIDYFSCFFYDLINKKYNLLMRNIKCECFRKC